MSHTKAAISVVVPVYNVEDYVKRCLDSLVMQTMTAIEVLVVDDGSTDGSGAICDEYAVRYDTIQVLHKPNGGLSDARNYGLARATGEYVQFVDSDDYLEPDACEALLAETGAGDVDMVIGRATLEKPSAAMQRFETVAAQLACHRVYTGKEYLIGCLSGGALRVEAWRSLYRRAFLQQNDLHFQKGIMHEDEEFTPRALLAAQKVVLSDRAFYHYDNARTGSIMNNSAASLRKLTHRVQIYNQQRELYRTVQPRRLRRLLEDDLSWKYLDCVCRYDPAKRDELAVGRTVPLRCAYKPKRKLKALAYAICPTLYTNHFGKN